MRVVDLGGGASALEPSEVNEAANTFTSKELRRLGLSKEVIDYFSHFDDGAVASRSSDP